MLEKLSARNSFAVLYMLMVRSIYICAPFRRRRRWHELHMDFAIAALFIGFMPHKDVFNYIAEGGRAGSSQSSR